jgi:hypothetical protein
MVNSIAAPAATATVFFKNLTIFILGLKTSFLLFYHSASRPINSTRPFVPAAAQVDKAKMRSEAETLMSRY